MPAALYGCGIGNDGAPLSSLGDFGTIAGLEFGLGYAIKPFLRLEAGIQYRPDFTFEGGANFTQLSPGDRRDVTAELSVLSGMTAAYLDIGELLLFHYASIGPFIGIGGGLSRIEIGETRMDFPETSTIVPGGDRVSFSWMLTAGLSASLSPRLMLDVGWRYTDHGRIETARGEGRVVKREGGHVLAAFDLIETKGDLRSHGLNVSLRYAF
jgi:opacity protein-like surface antigen